jgi:predicted secreted protein
MTTGAVTGLFCTVKIGTYVVAGAKTVTLTLAGKAVDVSSADDIGWASFLLGRRDWKVETDGLYIYSDTAKKLLWAYWMQTMSSASAVTPLAIIFTTPDGNTYTGSAVLTDLTWKGPYDAEMTHKATFQGTGVLAAAHS